MAGKSIMIQGTMSNSGKTFVTAGLCRVFAQDGHKTAPFKSQNMANYSCFTKENKEISRAQAVQAEAAMTEPSHLMNPILLKPVSTTGSELVVNGETRGVYPASEYFKMKAELKPEVRKAHRILTNKYDRIVIEGAGSPAEINLSEQDFVNMGMAEIADAPVLLVADIDRGGVFASIYGTVKLLPRQQQKRIKGIIINKFRGEKALLESGISMIEDLTGIPVVGVLPMAKIVIEDEDSLSSQDSAAKGDSKEQDSKAYREEQYNKLADLLREHLDMDYINSLFLEDEYADLPYECQQCTVAGCGGKSEEKPLIGKVHLFTGSSKSKTAVSLGLASRCAGKGLKVLMHQFSIGLEPGDEAATEENVNITRVPVIPLKRYAFMMNEEEKQEARAKNDQKFEELVKLAKSYDVLILDEALYAVDMGILSEEKIIEWFGKKPMNLEVVLTGRTASEEMVEAADFVTELNRTKQDFNMNFGCSGTGIE